MTPQDVDNLIIALQDGDEDAYHTLVESRDEILPELIAYCATAIDGKLRATVVGIVWQHRSPLTISFLGSALKDEHPEVWKQAIDGLVTIGGDHSLETLKTVLAELKEGDARLPWIVEAINQIEAPIK